MSLGAGIFLYEGPDLGYDAFAGVHLAPNTLIELSGYRAASLAPLQRSESVAVALQHFVDRRVYLKVGPRLRHIEMRDLLDFREYEQRLVQDDLGADLALGMRWQTDAVVVGLEFFGVYAPLKSFTTKRQVVDGSNGEVLTSDRERFSARVDVRAANFYLGASF